VPKILRNLRITECSSVDAGANQYARVLIRKRNGGEMRTVTKRQVADALRSASWSDLEAIAKRLVPGVDGKIAMHRAGALVDGWNDLLLRRLSMTKSLGASGNPQKYGGSFDASIPHASLDDVGDTDEDAAVGLAGARRPETAGEDDDGRADHLTLFNDIADRIQRGQKVTRSRALELAAVDPKGRRHFMASLKKSRQSNVSY
jgi:hypothetical protein